MPDFTPCSTVPRRPTFIFKGRNFKEGTCAICSAVSGYDNVQLAFLESAEQRFHVIGVDKIILIHEHDKFCLCFADAAMSGFATPLVLLCEHMENLWVRGFDRAQARGRVLLVAVFCVYWLYLDES